MKDRAILFPHNDHILIRNESSDFFDGLLRATLGHRFDQAKTIILKE